MTIKPNRRTRRNLEQLSNHSHCSMAGMAMKLLREYVNAHDLKTSP